MMGINYDVASPLKGPRRVTPPRNSFLSDQFAGADLLDAYAITLPVNATRDIAILADAVFGHPPPWFSSLIRVRDVVASTLSLKTTQQVRTAAEAEGTGHIDFFPIRACFDREMILGENDTHLDFLASLMLRNAANDSTELVTTTVVHCKNRVGRAYLASIRPFHHIVVRSSLDRARRRGWPNTDATNIQRASGSAVTQPRTEVSG